MAATDHATRYPGKTLTRYFAREALAPVLLAIGGLTLVVLTRDLVGFTELVLNRGVGAWPMVKIAFFEAVPIAATLLPFAGLVGFLVALGRLGADREILAIEASGVSAARMMGPVSRVALVLALATAGLSFSGAPAAQRALDAAFEQIARAQPWTQIRPGAVNRFGGWQLEAREVGPKGDELRGVLLWTPEIGETIFALSGRVSAGDDGAVRLELDSGSLVLSPELGPRQLRFDHLRTTLPASEEARPRDPADRFQAMSFEALGHAALDVGDHATALGATREWHRRFSLPVTTLLLGFLAVPLFLTRSHFSRSGGSVLGIAVTVATFALAQLGEGLTQAGVTDVAGGVWLPNAVLAALSAGSYWLARREGVMRRSLDSPSERGSHLRALPGRRPDKTHRRALPRYVSARYLQLATLAFGALLAAYLIVDVMERLDWFARYRATGGEVLRFYAARLPLLASRVVPMALLVASALLASLLAAEGELIGMRSCGIPAVRALAPVLLIVLAVTPLFFLLRNVVVPRTNALADELKQTEIKADYYEQLAESRKTAVWHRSGSRVIEAARFDIERGDARELTIYQLGEDGLPVSRSDARSARHVGRGVWRLSGPSRLELAADRVTRVPARSYADLGDEFSDQVDSMHLSVAALGREIGLIEADGYDTTGLRVDYHVKWAEAFACIVLPFSVLLFAVTGPPFPAPAQTLLVSAILAVAHVLLTGVGTSLGYGGTLSPPVAGWLPNAAFAALAAGLGTRVWKRL
jgi:LPS export ABC transporter permease LptG